jgi:hypothetical protein
VFNAQLLSFLLLSLFLQKVCGEENEPVTTEWGVFSTFSSNSRLNLNSITLHRCSFPFVRGGLGSTDKNHGLQIFFVKRQRLMAVVACLSKSAAPTPEVLADAHCPFQWKFVA